MVLQPTPPFENNIFVYVARVLKLSTISEMDTTRKAGCIRLRKNQVEMIVEAMEKNPFLNVNKFSNRYTLAKKNQDWEDISKKLNSAGGAVKSVKCWQKSWVDKKSDVKKRKRLIEAGMGRNGENKLTPLEERIFLLIQRAAKEEELNADENALSPDESASPASPSLSSTQSSYVSTTQANSFPIRQESSLTEEFIVPDTQSDPPENHLLQESQTPKFQSLQAKIDRLRSLEISEPALPASGSSYISTTQTNSLHIKQEPTQTEEFILPETLSHPPENQLPLESPTPRCQTLQAKDDRLRSLGMRVPPLPAISPSPASESTYLVTTQTNSLPIKQEPIQTEEFILLDTSSHPPENCLPQELLPPPQCQAPQANEDRLQSSNPSVRTNPVVLAVESIVPDTQSPLPPTDSSPKWDTVANLQAKTCKLRSSNKRVRAKPVVLKTENAQRLVDGQVQMATALTRCADALAKQNELQERALEIKKRKVDVQERALEIEKQKADVFLEILSIVKNKFS